MNAHHEEKQRHRLRSTSVLHNEEKERCYSYNILMLFLRIVIKVYHIAKQTNGIRGSDPLLIK